MKVGIYILHISHAEDHMHIGFIMCRYIERSNKSLNVMCFVETMNDVLFLYLKIDAMSYTIIIRYVWDLINMPNSKSYNLVEAISLSRI